VRNERYCVTRHNVPTTVRELEVKEDVSVTSQLVPVLPPKIVILAALHIWLSRDNGKTHVDKESELIQLKSGT
jgi:hypothetical protein